MNTYTVFANKVDEVKKAYNRYAKKAEKVGIKCSISIGDVYGKEVTVYDVDTITNTQHKMGTVIMEVVDINIDFPEYKLGNYSVVGVIEHGEDNKNLVYNYGDNKIPSKYTTAKGICEHCKTNHKRVKTVILKDMQNDEFKQVGTGCLKEYTGVTDISLVKAYEAFDSMLIDNNADRGYVGTPDPKTVYVETEKYLAKCIHVYNEKGYNKSNKFDANNVKNVTNEEVKIAKTVIEYFKAHEKKDLEYGADFFNNVKTTVERTYCKPNNGFVAYAYVLYLKEIETDRKNEEKKKELSVYEYYGEVGDKITVEVTGRCITSYATSYNGYTYSTVYIYKFIDKDNKHIFIWKTSKVIETTDGVFNGTISGTIKEHGVYGDGNIDEKQTVLTRCKAMCMVTA